MPLFTVGDANCVIIGVVNDFHTESLRNEKLPVVFYMHPVLNCSSLFVKYESGPNIFLMLSKEFVWVVVLATLLAMPFTWYSASQWLSGFVYRIDIPWWIFISTFAGICILTVLIICVQGFNTVKTNPTKTLRSE
ncbi:MAG: hypothetical protein IPJ20_01085 [Flammeovirgaceae bacterium]|nr:hypothetical protein [Flammeovirgaceae bacterium]